MLLQLDSKHRVIVDSSCQNYILESLDEVKDKKTGDIKYEWNGIGFHGLSIRSVLNQYKNHALAISELETVNDVLNRLSELENTIHKVADKVKDIKLVVSKND